MVLGRALNQGMIQPWESMSFARRGGFLSTKKASSLYRCLQVPTVCQGSNGK